jgi:hypothetical protein
MGQSKRPAVCSCGIVGPARGHAAVTAGWTSRPNNYGKPAAWTCPHCIEIAVLERRIAAGLRQHAPLRGRTRRTRALPLPLLALLPLVIGLGPLWLARPRGKRGGDVLAAPVS